MDDIQRARQFAIAKHGKQLYGEHPYIYHLDSVVNLGKSMGESEEVLIVAYLHDTLEDTKTSKEKIEEVFGAWVSNAVVTITKLENEKYPEYIHRVSKYEVSRRVKVLDLLCNLKETILMEDNSRKEKLMNKYQTALYFLATQTT